MYIQQKQNLSPSKIACQTPENVASDPQGPGPPVRNHCCKWTFHNDWRCSNCVCLPWDRKQM